METKCLIREATSSDCRDIWLINRDSLGYIYTLEQTGERLCDILSKGRDKIYVAQMDNRVIGYIHSADYDTTYFAPLKNILTLAVEQGHRGHGVGKALLLAVESWAAETGAGGVRLVSGFNRQGAHSFYLACGYTDRKDQKNFIKIFS